MVEGDSFRSKVSRKEFKISNNFTCDSSGVVYLLDAKLLASSISGALSRLLGLDLIITSPLVVGF